MTYLWAFQRQTQEIPQTICCWNVVEDTASSITHAFRERADTRSFFQNLVQGMALPFLKNAILPFFFQNGLFYN